MKYIILAIDAGSSSIRCTAYEYLSIIGGSGNENENEDRENIDTQNINEPHVIKAIDGMSHTITMSAINPNTGHIYVQQVLSAIDECVDKVLYLLRASDHDISGCSGDTTNGNCVQIVAIGFSTFVMNLIGVDTNGSPVDDVATCSYACNRDDVVKECQDLRDNLGPEKLKAMYQRTGAPIHVSYALSQLLAFYGNVNNQDIAKRIHSWQTISSICSYRWGGRRNGIQMPISFSEASWTGMLNFRTCTWDDDTIQLLATSTSFEGDISNALPPLVDYDATLPFLSKGIPQYNGDGSVNHYWEKWPELRTNELRFFLGLGDGAAANVGSKCGCLSLSDKNERQRIAVTIGTSAAARVCLPLPVVSSHDEIESTISIPPGLFCYRVNKSTILVGGALTDGGSVIEWARSLFNLQSTESFDACIHEVTAMYDKRCCVPSSSSSLSSGNVTMIPFLTGERSTGYRSGARGCISSISRETTANDIMYACLESVVLRLVCVLQLIENLCSSRQLEESKPHQTVIVASGSALECSTLWRQMLADCSLMDVVVDSDSSEGTSRGVAMLLATSLHQNELGKSEQLVIKSETKTNSVANEYWRNALATQESLVQAVFGPTLFDKA